MRYIWQHIKIILENYNGELPLALFLKNYYRQYPILGGRDRKLLTAMAYSWYRCSKGIVTRGGETTIEEKVKISLQICNSDAFASLPQTDSISLNETSFSRDLLFPFDIPFSNGITKNEWLQSMQSQPDLFIRIRKDKGKVISLLNEKNIPVNYITDTCIALPNGTKVDEILPAESYVVQDAASQKTGTFFHPKKNGLWYDCCAGAGGKSLLLKDMEPGVRLTVSDKRDSIIHNLQKRFRQYGHVLPVAHITDAGNAAELNKILGNKQFDHIICDAPCSGSGTWARTPEQLYFFDPAVIEKYQALQRQIAINVLHYLKDGGSLIYITCSVFRAENEEIAAEIIKQTGLTIIESQLINGISIKADSMFIAVMGKGLHGDSIF
jgi:16S rRNA (cytosine967-C5)-methyltransferase